MRRSWGPIQLGLVWQRLNGLMDEVAHAFVRTSFSVVVRENWDLAVSLLDHEGREFAQSSRSVPSFIGTMPRTVRAMLERYPRETLEPGGVLIANDPWIGSGHLNDITMVQPLFRGGAAVRLAGTGGTSGDAKPELPAERAEASPDPATAYRFGVMTSRPPM